MTRNKLRKVILGKSFGTQGGGACLSKGGAGSNCRSTLIPLRAWGEGKGSLLRGSLINEEQDGSLNEPEEVI